MEADEIRFYLGRRDEIMTRGKEIREGVDGVIDRMIGNGTYDNPDNGDAAHINEVWLENNSLSNWISLLWGRLDESGADSSLNMLEHSLEDSNSRLIGHDEIVSRYMDVMKMVYCHSEVLASRYNVGGGE